MKLRCSLAMLLAFAGCDQLGSSAELQAKIEGVDQRVARTEADLKELTSSVELDRSSRDDERVIKLEFDGDGYQRIHSNMGVVLVTIEGAESYLDGFKLKLLVGNLSAATFAGAELQFTWMNDKGKTTQERLQTRMVSATQRFAPGTWTPVEAKISPLTQESLKGLMLSLNFNQVILKRP